MKKISFFILMAFVCVMAAKADTIRIMGIGNSFTVDALEQHFQPILTAQGDTAIVGYPYRGGTHISEHVAWVTSKKYNYREFRDGKYTSTGVNTSNLKDPLELEPWDYVVIQSDHDSVGIYASYEPWLTQLVDYVKNHCSNKNVKIGFYMTWPYDSISSYGAFEWYNNDNQLMYDSIIACAKKVMATHPDFFLIPAGTAIQNARTSYIGHKLNRDGYHLNEQYGRYIAALSWYRAIYGVEPDSVKYAPATISNYCANMCRAAVKGAFEQPYDTTSLRKDFGKSEEESQPADESQLRRVTFNGMNVALTEGVYDYVVPVDAAITPSVTMYSFPRSQKAEQNITDKDGADIEKDPKRYGYFPLPTPQLGDTLTYTNRVLAEDLVHTTTYVFHLVGVASTDLLYKIGSREDLEDFAAAVNAGSYGLNAEMTNSFFMDHTQQDSWHTPIGTIEHPYTGTFDGKGYTISGFVIYSVDSKYLYNLEAIGLFGAIKNATIANLSINGTTESYFNKDANNYSPNNNKYCGILCGWMANSTISRCDVSCPIFTNLDKALGYICGSDQSNGTPSTIDRCYSEGTWRIRRSGQYAGILGYAYNVKISNCYSLVKLQLQKDFSARMGGILGYANASSGRSVTIENCYFAGAITDDRAKNDATTNQTFYSGGIASVFNGSQVYLNNCYYLTGSAPSEFGQHKNYTTKQSAATFPKVDLTNGVLLSKLGAAFVQGVSNPEINPSENPEERIFANNNWNGEDWTWKEMTQGEENVYTLDRVVFGGTGVKINNKAVEFGSMWFTTAAIAGDSIAEKDTVSFVFNLSDSTLTATLIGRPGSTPKVKKYYITGDSTLVGDKAWQADALEMTDSAYTFAQMSSGTYQLKITDGTWTNSWGYANLTQSSSEGLSSDTVGSICFTVETPNDVVVSIANGEVTVTGIFKKSDTSISCPQNSESQTQQSKVLYKGRLLILRDGKYVNVLGF